MYIKDSVVSYLNKIFLVSGLIDDILIWGTKIFLGSLKNFLVPSADCAGRLDRITDTASSTLVIMTFTPTYSCPRYSYFSSISGQVADSVHPFLLAFAY